MLKRFGAQAGHGTAELILLVGIAFAVTLLLFGVKL
jgi:hypothetical protein